MARKLAFLLPFSSAALSVAAFWPGSMSADSCVALLSARTHAFQNKSPPMMGLVWGVLDRIVPGPVLLVVMHAALLALGCAVLFWLRGQRRRDAWLLLLPLFPPVFALLAHAWKDVAVGVGCFAGMAFTWAATRRRVWALPAIAALTYAQLCRHNALLATAPLFVAVAWVCLPRAPRWAAAGGAVVATLALQSLGGAAVSRLAHEEKVVFGPHAIMAHDLVGVSLETREILVPDFLIAEPNTHPTLEQLQSLYYDNTVDPLYYNQGPLHFVDVSPGDMARLLTAAWWAAVKAHPAAYVVHRWRMFRHLLDFDTPAVGYVFHPQVDPNGLGVEKADTALARRTAAGLHAMQNWLVFRMGYYLLALILLALVAWVRRAWLALCVCASGLAYCAGYFPLSVADDFRYLWWTLLAVPMSVAVLDAREKNA